MEICSTQYSSENRLTAIHHGGLITMTEEGVYFSCPKSILRRLRESITFEGLKNKVEIKVQVIGDDREVTSITYRNPERRDDGRIYFSSIRIRTDDDVRSMLNIHDDILQSRRPLELYVEHQRSVHGI